MSENDYNLNNSFDNYQNVMNQPFKRNKTYNINTEAIPKRYKSPVIYDVGVDNYVFNEIKKAKYQGAFDPGSLGNKNIFLDSNKTYNKNSGYNQQKMKKKANYNRLGEGKNLLILKSETQYPINYGYNTVNQDVNNDPRQGKNIYNFNNYYIETKNNNYRNIYARSNDNKRNFNSPSNNERNKNYLLKDNNYLTKTINLQKLNRDYDKRFNEPNKTLYEKYSTNTISFNNPLKNYSPTFAPSRNTNLIKKNTMNYLNQKKFNNISKDENEIINDTYNFDIDNEFDDYIFNERSIDKKDANKDVKLINFYRRKILNLFFWHINNFYKLYFKSLFKEIIDILRRNTGNTKHNFENKTIKNIAEIKKTLKKNSFYYGKNRKYNNVLKEVQMKKDINNLQLENENNNYEIFEDEKHLNTESNNIENKVKKLYNINNSNKKIASDKKQINKKIFIGNKNNDQTKKYIKKKIPQGIYGKKIVPQKYNKLINSNEKNNEGINNKNIQQNNLIKKIENTPIIRKKLKFPKSAFKDNQIFNSGIKIIDNNYLKNNNNNNNDSIKFDKQELENNKDKNLPENDQIFSENFSIDKNVNYTIQNQSDKKNEYIELNSKENDLDNTSTNRNLENAITIITKVIENKEKDDKKNKIAFLIKIINNKINKDKAKNFELINKYFNKLKQIKNENSEEEEKKSTKKLELNKGLIKKTKLKRNKKLKKNLFLSDLEDNKEKIDLSFEKNAYKSEDDDKYRNKRNKDKIRIIIKQTKLQENRDNYHQYDYYKPKTPTKQKKNYIIENNNNNKTPKIIIKKTINIIVNKAKNNINEPNNENKNKLNEFENNLNINKKDSDKQILNDIEKKDDENNLMNSDIDIKENNKSNENKEEIIEDNFDEDFSNNVILNKKSDEKIDNTPFITETEKYEDYQNFIFYLRAQLIYCFLTNKNHEDSLLD